MNIEGIGKQQLINHKMVTQTFPFSIEYEGELIYEVVRIKDGYPLFWLEHLNRMVNSLNLSNQDGQRIVDEIEGHIRTFIEAGEFKDNNIKIIIGNFNEKSYDYIAYYVPSYYPDMQFYQKGAKVVTLNHERKNPNAKIINSDLAEKVAAIRKETDAYEVALIDRQGIVTEGSRSNLFFLKDQCVYVSQGHKILKGITMIKVIELLEHLDLSYKEENVFKEHLNDYEACFMTSTSNNVLPIDTIDEKQFDSSHHALIVALMTAFDALIKEDQLNYKTTYKEANNE